jgi:hypothetical protein
MPGVRGVFTAADLDADGIGPLPCIAQVATVAPLIAQRHSGVHRSLPADLRTERLHDRDRHLQSASGADYAARPDPHL